jgi:hypothetical protein
LKQHASAVVYGRIEYTNSNHLRPGGEIRRPKTALEDNKAAAVGDTSAGLPIEPFVPAVVVDVAVDMSAVALRRKTVGDLGWPACEIWF